MRKSDENKLAKLHTAGDYWTINMERLKRNLVLLSMRSQ